MRLVQGPPRFIRESHSSRAVMGDMLLVLLMICVLPVVYHGWRAAWLVLFSMAVCMGCYILFQLVTVRSIRITDASPLITGAMIALLMPASIPFWVVAAADAFAILAAKEPFGGTGRTPFNPAAAGVAFVTVLWPERVFSYYSMNIGQHLTLSADSLLTTASPAAMLRDGIQPGMMPFEMLWGRYEGPMGATSAAVLGAGLLFLLVRKSADWRAPVCFTAAAALYAAMFPRLSMGSVISVKYELLAGSLLFCAFYMITDPCTSPRTGEGQCIWGALGGVLLMLLRCYGGFEQGACFAVLLMNALSPLVDRAVLYCRREMRRREQSREKRREVHVSKP